jgi:hypothetical protein
MGSTEATLKQSRLLPNILAAILTLISVTLAIIAWQQINSGPLNELSVYDIFPLFGLLAFSLLWCLYTTDATANYLEVSNESLRPYYRITGYVLLLVILTHPTLLVMQLWRDGFGLPPGSYSAYVGESLVWVALLGTASLFAFLAYELHRWFKKRKWWKWVVYANDIAMLAVFYHGLRIGGELQSGWFRYVWFFYGSMFVIYMIYLRFYRRLLSARAPA